MLSSMGLLPPLAGVCFLFFLHISASVSRPQSILQYVPETSAFLSADEFSVDQNISCESWKYSVEVDNLQNWTEIPPRCKEFVWKYMNGTRYTSDCEVATNYTLAFAKSVNVSADGKDAWIFEIDETLLLNLSHIIPPDGKQSVDERLLPAIPSSLRLYNKIRGLNFKIFIITRRDESQRFDTVVNLEAVEYHNWDRLIMRDKNYSSNLVYKAEKRKDLIDEGFTIRGNVGDQWSDLIGNPRAERSFKMPNPMYYVA